MLKMIWEVFRVSMDYAGSERRNQISLDCKESSEVH